MFRREVLGVHRVLMLSCIALLLVQPRARGDGSIFFNGANTPATTATSKLENADANVLDSSSDITICVWVYADGLGEADFGTILRLDAGETAIRLRYGERQTLDNITLQGTYGSSAPLIRVQQPLKNSVIVARVLNAGTILDLYVVAAGRAQGATSSTIQLAAKEDFNTDDLNDKTVTITGGPGTGESKTIDSYDGATDTATIIGTWATTPTFASTYEVKGDMLGTGNFIQISGAESITGEAVNLDPNGWDDWNNTVIVNGLFRESPTAELTIASGAITLTQRNHVVDTEADAASDDLTTINGGLAGRTIVLRASNTNRTVVLKDGVGNLKLEGDFSLDNTEDTITLYFDGSNWLEKARRNNGS